MAAKGHEEKAIAKAGVTAFSAQGDLPEPRRNEQQAPTAVISIRCWRFPHAIGVHKSDAALPLKDLLGLRAPPVFRDGAPGSSPLVLLPGVTRASFCRLAVRFVFHRGHMFLIEARGRNM